MNNDYKIGDKVFAIVKRDQYNDNSVRQIYEGTLNKKTTIEDNKGLHNFFEVTIGIRNVSLKQNSVFKKEKESKEGLKKINGILKELNGILKELNKYI